MIMDMDKVESGMDEQKMSLRGTGTLNAKWQLDYIAQHRETVQVFLNLAYF